VHSCATVLQAPKASPITVAQGRLKARALPARNKVGVSGQR
jgi:hypothetical protein